MTKKEDIEYWIKIANRYCQTVIEKLLNAIWVKESISDNTPPFTHDLDRLAEECGLELGPDDMDFLTVINGWNIRGRYPDFTKSFHRNTTDSYLKAQRVKVNELKEWLEKKI